MDLFGTLLSPLYPLFSALGYFFAADDDDKGDDEAGKTEDGQKSDEGDSDDEDDGDGEDEGDDEEEDSDEEDDLDDDLPEAEATRRNAARLDSEKDVQLTASMEALVDLLVENPDIAERKLTELRDEQPVLAARLAKMYKNKANNKLGDMLEGADDAVKAAFKTMAEKLNSLEQKTEQQRTAEEKRVYLAWEKGVHPYLNPKSREGRTQIGKRLRDEFAAALDRISNDKPVDEDILEDALAMAKRRVGWNDGKVKRAVDKFALQQAAKGRGTTAGKNGKGGAGGGEAPKADPKMAAAFNKAGDAAHLKKVAEAKKAAGFK